MITTLPETKSAKWIAGMPNIAMRWAEATEARGIPAGDVVRAYMNAVRERGAATALRDWDRPN